MRNSVKYIWKILIWLFSGIGILFLTGTTPPTTSYRVIIHISLLICAIAFVLSSIDAFASFLIRRKIYDYLISKIHEFSHFLLGDKKLYAPAIFQYDCYEAHEKYHVLSKIISKFTCYNQGVYAGYSLLAGDLHKDLRKAVEAKAADEKIKELIVILQIQLYKEFKKIMDNNVDRFILDYFKGRSRFIPRVIIKGWHGDNIMDIYRRQFGPIYNIEKNKVNSNEGFVRIRETGKYYLCNNIPDAAYNGTYYNVRLNNNKLKQLFTVQEIKEGTINFTKWKQCWSRYRLQTTNQVMDPSDDSCYQSTLIIPITLLNNEDLSDKIKERFRIPEIDHPGKGRAFFGFLCFDNREANYFNEEVDWKIGYIYADIISLYLIDLMRYTQYSATFMTAVQKFPDIAQYYTSSDSSTFMPLYKSP